MSNYPPQPGYPPPDYSLPPGYPPPQPAWTPPPRSGMGCGAKLLIAMGILLVLLILACCGGVFLFIAYFQKSVTQDPAAIETITREITGIEVPDSLKPEFGGRLKVPFAEQVLGLGVVYGDEPSGSKLILLSAGNIFDQQTAAKIRQSLETSLRRQEGPGEEEEELLQTEESVKRATIRGEKATFMIVKGTGAKSHRPRIRVQGQFQGSMGPAVVILDADPERLPEEKVLKMIESIQ